jgi:heme/copper-type cytochrome/quinol oxidase subunit 2
MDGGGLVTFWQFLDQHLCWSLFVILLVICGVVACANAFAVARCRKRKKHRANRPDAESHGRDPTGDV